MAFDTNNEVVGCGAVAAASSGSKANAKILMDENLIANDSDDDDDGENVPHKFVRINSMCQADLDDEKNDQLINVKECMVELAQQIIVPMFFNLMAVTLSYSAIAIFTCFDSIRIYSLFTCKFSLLLIHFKSLS